MREIKFRAWNGKRMIDEDSFFVRYGKAWKFMEFDEPQKTDYPLMQYTGLKDKNGVEIYEGDIVTGEYHNLHVDYSKSGAVEMGYTSDSDGWLNGCTYGWVTTSDSSLADLEECEVIGNIYQNPELLKSE